MHYKTVLLEINRLPCSSDIKLFLFLQILIDSAQHLSKYQVCAAVCYLWNCNHSDAVHKKLCKPIRQISVALPESDRHPVIIILDQASGLFILFFFFLLGNLAIDF